MAMFGMIVMFSTMVLNVPLVSENLTVNVEVPAVVGVPPTTPSLLSESPGGRFPAANVQTPLPLPPVTLRF